MYRSLISVLALVATASAATIKIDVGEEGLNFTPSSQTAAVGDILEFHFFPGGHGAAQGTFETPCTPSTNGFFSGFIPGNTDGDTVFTTTVTSTDPIWFYCPLAEHCQSGMVGVINPPADKSISDYSAAAQKVAVNKAPGSVSGGTVTTIMSSAATSSMGLTTTTSMTTAGTVTTMPASSISGMTTTKSGSSTASVATATSSKASAASSSGSAAATTSSSGAGWKSGEMATVIGLAVAAGGLVVLMG
jgi:hypothetical protein